MTFMTRTQRCLVASLFQLLLLVMMMMMCFANILMLAATFCHIHIAVNTSDARNTCWRYFLQSCLFGSTRILTIYMKVIVRVNDYVTQLFVVKLRLVFIV